MYLLDVIPPLWLMITLFDHLVDTMLAKVLVNNISTRNFMELIFDVIWGAVFSITETLLSLKVSCTSRTSPRHETRRNVYITLQLVRISIKFFDKVK